MKTEIFENHAAFRARPDKSVNGVSKQFALENPGWDEERGNTGCWNCTSCSDCSDCFGCSNCSFCFQCSDCSDCSDCVKCNNCFHCVDGLGVTRAEASAPTPEHALTLTSAEIDALAAFVVAGLAGLKVHTPILDTGKADGLLAAAESASIKLITAKGTLPSTP